MNQFQLTFNVPESPEKIQHGDSVIFIGSCFSDEIASKAKQAGWKALSNPFGTIFHPLILSDFISDSFTKDNIERIVRRNDLFLSWDASSSIYSTSESDLSSRITKIREEFLNELKSAKFLFITFGTAWGYELKYSKELVANCHKFPADQFTKKLTESSAIVERWKEVIDQIRKVNPEIQIAFTVSPVRHSKDGLIENNRSKAILIEAVRQLESTSKVSYFPSYEIVIDELRDYRFYAKDMVHPSEQAIDYVWSKFISCYCTEKTLKLNELVMKYQSMKNHRTLFPESEENKKHMDKIEKLKFEILSQEPKVHFEQ